MQTDTASPLMSSINRALKRPRQQMPFEDPRRNREIKQSDSVLDLIVDIQHNSGIKDWRTVRKLLSSLQIKLGNVSAENNEEICQQLASTLSAMSPSLDVVCTAIGIIEAVIQRSHMKQSIWGKTSTFFKSNNGLGDLKGDVDESLLSLFAMLLKNRVISSEECQDVLNLLWRNIRVGSSSHRVCAIKFLIAYALNGGLKSGSWTLGNIEQELGPLCEDRDARVRSAALDGFMELCSEDKGLSYNCYNIFTKLVRNSDQSVRLKCLRLIQFLAIKYGNREVRSSKGVKLALNDDAFSIICNAVNDSEVKVRTEAAKLLGKFMNVSENFLLQTLDKKIMVKMKIRRDGSSCAGTSEWATGKRLGADVPLERGDEDAQSIISTGACGAFVTALEDEFMAVRQAAVYSLGRLAANRPNFANACIEHLADMFNDEIEEVRLDAIKALTPLVVHGTLQKYQLPTILNVLDDAAQESRFALHELLGKSNFYDSDCLQLCVKTLLHSMERYPLDTTSIYRCLSKLGSNHATFVQNLINSLLSLHPFFDSNEQTIDDPYYVAKLMLILNAASNHSVICSLIPSYVIRHYRYLRTCYPHFIAPIKEIERTSNTKKDLWRTEDDNPIDHEQQVGGVLEVTYNHMVNAQKSDRHEEKENAFLQIIKDLEILEETEARISIPIRYMKSLFEISRLGEHTRQNIIGGDFHVTLPVIEQCLDGLDSLHYNFAYSDSAVLRFIAEFRYFLVLQYLTVHAVTVHRNPSEMVEILKSAITLLHNQVKEVGLDLTAGIREDVKTMVQAVMNFGSDEKPKCEFVTGRMLLNLLKKIKLCPPPRFGSHRVIMKTVDVLEPKPEWISDHVVRFVSNLPTGISVTAMLYNLEQDDLLNLRLRISYPDKLVTYFRPRTADIVVAGPNTYRLTTTVLVSSNSWADKAEVHICCGLYYQKKTQAIKKANSFFIALPDHKRPASDATFSVKVHPMPKSS